MDQLIRWNLRWWVVDRDNPDWYRELRNERGACRGSWELVTLKDQIINKLLQNNETLHWNSETNLQLGSHTKKAVNNGERIFKPNYCHGFIIRERNLSESLFQRKCGPWREEDFPTVCKIHKSWWPPVRYNFAITHLREYSVVARAAPWSCSFSWRDQQWSAELRWPLLVSPWETATSWSSPGHNGIFARMS